MSAVPDAPRPERESQIPYVDSSIGLIELAVGDIPELAAHICETPFASLALPGATFILGLPREAPIT